MAHDSAGVRFRRRFVKAGRFYKASEQLRCLRRVCQGQVSGFRYKYSFLEEFVDFARRYKSRASQLVYLKIDIGILILTNGGTSEKCLVCVGDTNLFI